MSGVIPKEELANYTRWQIDSFDTGPSVQPTVAQQPPSNHLVDAQQLAHQDLNEPLASTLPLPTAEAIEHIHDEARKAGYEAGFSEGQKAGEIAAEQAMREVAQASADHIAQMVSSLQEAIISMEQSVADQILALSLEVARQMVCGIVKVDKTVLLPIIREAIAALPLHHGHLFLNLNPADAHSVRELMGDQLTQMNTQVVESSEVAPGGCIIKAGASEIDASLETRWRRVLEAIGTTTDTWHITDS
jgi:flagellar assembly protein FliH